MAKLSSHVTQGKIISESIPSSSQSEQRVFGGQTHSISSQLSMNQGTDMHHGTTSRPASNSTRSSLKERWKRADENVYLATIGRSHSSKATKGEKATKSGSSRKKPPPWICTIIAASVILVIIIAIVIPVAVVFSHKQNSNPTTSSAPGSEPAPTPNSNIVTLKQGQYQGTQLPNGITEFLGMQYAAPPVGNLRFAAPQSPPHFDGIKAATRYGPSCHGLGEFKSIENEDCLYLDLFVPTNSTDQSKLPVFVFIQGGGLQNANIHYNGSKIIAASGFQMITVAMTYRVNAFGFLASSELQDGASLNNGLKDQRMALQWVQDNIAQFGGDPAQVTLAGESGGAGSVVMQSIAYSGRDDHLFQATIAQSQSLQAVRDVRASQYQYDYIVGNSSCSGQDDTLGCLRGLSTQELVKAIANSPFPDGTGGDPVFPYNPVIDGDFLQARPIPAFTAGKYVNVPMIFGDDTDEGTIFVDPDKIQSKQDSDDFLRNNFPLINSTMLEQYGKLYNFSDTGSPDYWRQVAAAYGETRYTCPGLQLAGLVSKSRPSGDGGGTGGGRAWYFNYDVANPAAAAQDLGVKHGAEMPAVFGPAPTSASSASYRAGGSNADVVSLVQAYWTSFVRHHDPSTARLPSAPVWDPWSGDGADNNDYGGMLHIVANSTAMAPIPSGLASRCRYLNSIAEAIGQ